MRHVFQQGHTYSKKVTLPNNTLNNTLFMSLWGTGNYIQTTTVMCLIIFLTGPVAAWEENCTVLEDSHAPETYFQC